ncbi:hypothetical protein O181_101557, partial [Austropuccinia psidii MF-1]|nr:hypothetical protein [Austropuccinia psidii MF-1]
MLYSLVLKPPPFVQTLSPGHAAGNLDAVTCDQMHHVHSTHHAHSMRASRPPSLDSFVVNNDETISGGEWTPGPQAGRQEPFWTISHVPSSIELSTPPPRPPSDGHFTTRPERSHHPADEGWQLERTFELGPIVTMSCHQWDSNAKVLVAPDEPSQTNEPPIPGPSPSSQPPEDNMTCEPQHEVAPTQSTEEPF